MRKLFFLFSMLIMCFPIYVFGASGYFFLPEEPIEYAAYVSNPKGTNAYCFDNDDECINDFFSFETEINVENEVFYNGKLYAIVVFDDINHYINITDIHTKEKEIIPNINDHNQSVRNIYTYREVTLHSGPAFGYETIQTIPKGTTLTPLYYGYLWVYVEYNDIRGWVNNKSYLTSSNHDEYSGCVEDYGVQLYIFSDTQLMDTPDYGDNVIDNVPLGTNFDKTYLFVKDEKVSYYVDYNGKAGWLYTDENQEGFEKVVTKGYSLLTLKDLYIFNDYQNGKKIGKIPKYEDVYLHFHVSDGEGNDYYYVSYNNLNGWIIDYNDYYPDVYCYAPLFVMHYYEGYKLSEDIRLNDSLGNNIKIKAGEIIYTDEGFETVYYKNEAYENTEYELFNGELYYKYALNYKAENNVNHLKSREIISTFTDDVISTKSDDVISTKSDDVISTIFDDASPKKEAGGIIDILTKIPMIYYIIGGSVFVLIITILVIVIIKRNNKNVIKVEEGIIANSEVSSNVVEDNVMPSEIVSQEQTDNNKTQL